MYRNNSNECGHCGKKFKSEKLLRDHLDTYTGHCKDFNIDDEHFDEHPEAESEYQPTEDEIFRGLIK